MAGARSEATVNKASIWNISTHKACFDTLLNPSLPRFPRDKVTMAIHAKESTSLANGSGDHGTSSNGNGDAATGMASKLKRYPETGISVLIAGSGIGGLMTALECWRKGLSVEILERSAGPVFTGEMQQLRTAISSQESHFLLER